MKKTLRRYLSFRLHSDETSVDAKQLGTAIWKSLLSIYVLVFCRSIVAAITSLPSTRGV